MGTKPIWTRWPEDEIGTEMLHVTIDLPVDQVFTMVHGGITEFRTKCNEALGNREYTTTPWQPGPEDGPAAAEPVSSSQENVDGNSTAGAGAAKPGAAAGGQFDVAALRPGYERTVKYSASSMGSKYQNQELFRLVEVQPGQRYTVEVCVFTTAMYGDRFRPMLRHELRAVPGKDGSGERCDFLIRAALVFVTDVNWGLKKMIEKGATNGMADNFQTVSVVMKEYAAVEDVSRLPRAKTLVRRRSRLAREEAGGAEEGEGSELEESEVEEEEEEEEGELGRPPSKEGSPRPPQSPILESLAAAPLVQQLQPWAQKIQESAVKAPVLGRVLSSGTALVALCTLCMLCAIHVVILVMRFLESASLERHAHDPKDSVACLLSFVFKVVDVPDTVQEVLSSSLLMFMSWGLLNRLAAKLPPPPRPKDPRKMLCRVRGSRFSLMVKSVSLSERSSKQQLALASDKAE